LNQSVLQKSERLYDSARILKELEDIEFAANSNLNLQTWSGDGDPYCAKDRPRLKRIDWNEEWLTEPYYDTPYINQILEEEGMFRARVMLLEPKTCYTYHKDPTPRKHIPLITNEKCFFVFDDEVFYMPEVGRLYYADTTAMHTAVNASWEKRYHIVGCYKED